MRIRALVALVALAAGSLVVLAGPASGAITGTVDIRVELDLPYCCPYEGPAVFEVTGVTPGPGPELTGANLIANPSNWSGALIVDVDPETNQVIVTGDTADGYWDFETAVVTIGFSDPQFGAITTVSDTLWDTPEMVLSTQNVANGFQIRWDTGTATSETPYYTDGAGVFQLGDPVPPPTTPTTLPEVWVELNSPTTSFAPGEVMSIESGGWLPESEVRVQVFSDPIEVGSFVADSLGTIRFDWAIPETLAAGAHQMVLTGFDLAGSLRTVTINFDVTPLAGAIASLTPAPAPTPTSGQLPATGPPWALPVALFAALLIAVGAALVRTGRHRSPEAPVTEL